MLTVCYNIFDKFTVQKNKELQIIDYNEIPTNLFYLGLSESPFAE